MLAFPGMLTEPAKRAGIKVPPNPEDYDKNKYPHFAVFCSMQLGRRMSSATSHWENAKVIASIPDDKIRVVTAENILGMGFD
jgi:hypothetical protein